MNTLHFRGKGYAVYARHTYYLVDLGHSRFLLRLTREDLQALALMKYTGCIVRNHPDTLSPRVRSFLEAIAPGAVVPVFDFSRMHNLDQLRAQARANAGIPYDTQRLSDKPAFRVRWSATPRRIPHVRLVKASSLLPGMSIARWLMADDEQPGRRHGRILDIRTVNLLGDQLYLQCSYKRNPMEFNSPAVPYSLWLAPQQLVPVLAGWRDRADL